MSFDIWQTIYDGFGLSASDEIGEQLGELPAKAREGIRQAVPVILNAMWQSASKDEGLKSLSAAVGECEPSMLYRLRELWVGATREDFDRRAKRWASLFFGEDISGHALQLSRQSGLSTRASGELLGMMTPVVLSAVGHHRRLEKLDDASLKRAIKSQADDLLRNRAAFEQAPMSMQEIAELVEAAHREFGTHQRITIAALMDRMDLPRETAEHLRRELQWTGRLEAISESLTAAPGLADELAGRVYREIGPNTKLTASLLTKRLGINPRRADNLMEDMRRRGVLNTAGAIEGKFQSVATAEDIESVKDYRDYLNRNQTPQAVHETADSAVKSPESATETGLQSTEPVSLDWWLLLLPLLILIGMAWVVSRMLAGLF